LIRIQIAFYFLETRNLVHQFHNVVESDEASSFVFKGLDEPVVENLGKRLAVTGLEFLYYLEGADEIVKRVPVFCQKGELTTGKA
jgi:hypothetical protein